MYTPAQLVCWVVDSTAIPIFLEHIGSSVIDKGNQERDKVSERESFPLRGRKHLFSHTNNNRPHYLVARAWAVKR